MNLALIFLDLVPQRSPNGPSVPNNSLQQNVVGALNFLVPIEIYMDPTLQQTPKVLQNVEVPGKTVAADLLVRLDPKNTLVSESLNQINNKNILHVIQKEIIENIVPWTISGRPLIDGVDGGIWDHHWG
jgi:hypothetical protein